MPSYEVQHNDTLSPEQKDALAQAITKIHSHIFTTPSLFVNVRFVSIEGQEYYVGGRKSHTNRILAHVRPGGGRSTSQFNQLTEEINAAWGRITNLKPLSPIFILGTIIAGSEAGFVLPPAGEDKQWLKDNAEAFQQRADGGDEDFKALVSEMGTREDLKGILA